MSLHADAVETLIQKAHFEPEVALGVAEAIEVATNLTQIVTVPVLDARLQALRQEIKSDFAQVASEFGKIRGEFASAFAQMRAETAKEFEKQRTDMASELARMHVETAKEFAKQREELAVAIGKVRVDMAIGFGGVTGDFGVIRKDVEAAKAVLMRWVLLTLISSAAITAAVSPLIKSFMN